MALSMGDLQKFVGKSIDDICGNDFNSSSQNHCAHFVSHALSMKLGMLCGDMKFKTKGTGASIRCDELYNRLPNRGEWKDAPSGLDGILVFVTSAKNVRDGIMINNPQKHVGIYHSGKIFHFSNSQHKVVVDLTIDGFLSKFKNIYAGGDIELYFAAPPQAHA